MGEETTIFYDVRIHFELTVIIKEFFIISLFLNEL